MKTQIILTPEEYADLTDSQEEMPSKEALQTFCTMIADTVPVKSGWYAGIGKAWGCILTKLDEEWYCDECIAQNVCPYTDKQWSK